MARKLINIVKRQNLLCTLKQVNKKREFVPLTPQPDDRPVIYVHRNYQIRKSSPKRDGEFRKQVSWFGKSPETLLGVSSDEVIIEYIGAFPGRSYHCSVQFNQNNPKYIRTKPNVMKKLKSQLQHISVKDIERENNIAIKNDHNKQRNAKQLRNLKYNLNYEERSDTVGNLANKISKVEEMTRTHAFVQRVTNGKGRNIPLISLFTEQQMNDVKRFCCKDDGCVFGVDKTYNLGEYV